MLYLFLVLVFVVFVIVINVFSVVDVGFFCGEREGDVYWIGIMVICFVIVMGLLFNVLFCFVVCGGIDEGFVMGIFLIVNLCCRFWLFLFIEL